MTINCHSERTTAYWHRHPTRYCIHAVRRIWDVIDGASLPAWEQAILRKQMAAILNETSRPPTYHRLNAESVIAAARRMDDE